MSTWILFWFIVAILTTFGVLAFLVALARQLILVRRTVSHAQDALQPMVSQISSGMQQANRTAANLRPPKPTSRS